MVKVLFSLVLMIFSLHSYALSKVTASVDKNPVVVNESFVLTVVANDSVDNNALDTSVLLNDFIVGHTSVSSQTSIINGDTSRTTTWTTTLVPSQKGTFTIPALTVDGHKTSPINIKVVTANTLPASEQQALFITNEVSAKNIYVQQQITLTVKLYFSANLKRGSLSEPTLTGANIAQVGQDKESENIINGKRYRIIERVYAITPQQSGDMTLKSPIFSGEIIKPSSRRSNFFGYAETKPVSVIGENIDLVIKPIPSQITGTWLPSEFISLHQQWQPTPDQFKVGEPITRTITLTAAGLAQEQLPKITMQVPKGLKVYPDQEQVHTGVNKGRLVSQKVTNFALVASAAGEYLLPEITVNWWNTVTNRAEVATIPAEKVTVAINPDFATSSQPLPQTIDNTTIANQSAQTTNSALPISSVTNNNNLLQWLFLSLWLLTSFAWFISAKKPFSKKQTTEPAPEKVNDTYLALLAACKQNDGESVLKQLLPWINSTLPTQQTPLTTLDAIHHYVNNNALSAAIINLQQSYYGKEKQDWSGAELLSAIQALQKETRRKHSTDKIAINP